MKILVDEKTPPVDVKIVHPDTRELYGIVKIKHRLSLGDTARIQSATLNFQVGDQGTLNMSAGNIKQMIVTLQTAVVGWSGPAFDMEYSPNVWEKMSTEAAWIAEAVFDAINKANQPPTSDPENPTRDSEKQVVKASRENPPS